MMCNKGYARLLRLRRLKQLGATHTEMLDVFFKQIRCILEMAVSVWEPGLTVAESLQIERVQKCALHVILGDEYVSYDSAASFLSVERLSDRRPKLCLNLARRAEKNPKYQNWFSPAEIEVDVPPNTRSDKTSKLTKYKPVPHRTDRYRRSPLPYLTDLLNQHYANK